MRHVFISYVREDSLEVNRLTEELSAAGVSIWLDREEIRAGTRWKQVIRKAIQEGDFFLACFSSHYYRRVATHMAEELRLAIDHLRKIPDGRTWFIPVLLDECPPPESSISDYETLADLEQVRLYDDWDTGILKLIAAINPTVDERRDADLSNQTLPLKILFVASNPNKAEIRSDVELRELQHYLQRPNPRKRQVVVAVRLAARWEDLVASLREFVPDVFHFSGISTQSGNLLLEDYNGRPNPVPARKVRALLALHSKRLECVVVNSSHSLSCARVLASAARISIGTSAVVSDDACIAFSKGFYGAIGDGLSVEEAFEFGRAQILLSGSELSESDTFTLLPKIRKPKQA